MGNFGDDMKKLERKANGEELDLKAEDLIEKRMLLSRNQDETNDQD